MKINRQQMATLKKELAISKKSGEKRYLEIDDWSIMVQVARKWPMTYIIVTAKKQTNRNTWSADDTGYFKFNTVNSLARYARNFLERVY